MARRSQAAAGHGRPLEPGGPAGAGVGELVGGLSGNGRCGLLPQAPGDLAGGQLGPALAGDSHQPAPLVTPCRSSPPDHGPDGGGHPGGRQHREWVQPLAGGWSDPDPALGTDQTVCGAAGGHPVLPLEPDLRRSKAALAGRLRRHHPADPQTAQPQHGSPHGLTALADGPGLGDFPAGDAGHGGPGGQRWCGQHPAQHLPAHPRHLLPQPLE